MSRRTWKYIFSGVLALLTFRSAVSQDKKPEKGKADTVISYLPTGIRFGTDLIALARSRWSDNFKGWEVNADVDFYRYYLTVDYGHWAKQDSVIGYNLPDNRGLYQNDGTYFRFGGDVNLLIKDPDRNMFFLGARYGISHFSQRFDYLYRDPYYGLVGTTVPTTNHSGHWIEFTAGLRVKIVSGFWMGFTSRLKFAPSIKGASDLKPYDLPGYGLAEQNTYWGFNYQLFWRIPFRKAPAVVVKPE